MVAKLAPALGAWISIKWLPLDVSISSASCVSASLAGAEPMFAFEGGGEVTDFLAALLVNRVGRVLWLLELELIDGVHVRWEDCFRREEEEE